jgi:hypothetical protein
MAQEKLDALTVELTAVKTAAQTAAEAAAAKHAEAEVRHEARHKVLITYCIKHSAASRCLFRCRIADIETYEQTAAIMSCGHYQA